MSLFDIIRYGNTDLNSIEELSELSPDLFNAYRIAAFSYYGQSWSTTSTQHARICGMADWTESNIIKQAIFNKALKEWNNEPI